MVKTDAFGAFGGKSIFPSWFSPLI